MQKNNTQNGTFTGNNNSHSKNGMKQPLKPVRYLVKMDSNDETQDNFVSYNAKMDSVRLGDNKIASALAHAIFTSRTYNGEIFVDFGDGGEYVPYRTFQGKQY